MTKAELENLIKSASNKMRADDNTKGTAKYLEHFSWLLFLKVYEAVEDERALMAKIDGRPFKRVIDGKYRWSKWTNSGLSGPDLIAFITDDLFPHLRELAGTLEAEKVAELFAGVNTVMKSGYVLAEVVEIIDKVDFHAADDYHSMSVLYETLLAQMGGDSGWSGEFYTPRPVVELITRVVAPQLGETVYDPCCGSCGFLVEAYDELKGSVNTVEERTALQRDTLFGQESGELPFLLGTMNMILHGVLVPNVVRRNTLEQDVRSIQPSEQHMVVLTNPPFGGKENPQVQENFPVKSAATEILFLQHIMSKLKPGGRAGMVVPEGVLFRGDTFASVKARLLTEFDLYAVISLPPGVFAPYSDVKTNLIFFTKGQPTKSVWYYEVLHPTGKKFTKTKAIKWEHFGDVLEALRERRESDISWSVPVKDIVDDEYDLSAKNPNKTEELDTRSSGEILEALRDNEGRLHELLDELSDLVNRA